MVLFQDSMRAEEESFSKRSSLHFDTENDESFKQIKCSSYEEINITETVNLPKEDNKIPQNSFRGCSVKDHHRIQTDELGYDENISDNANQSGYQRKSDSQQMDDSQSMRIYEDRNQIENLWIQNLWSNRDFLYIRRENI